MAGPRLQNINNYIISRSVAEGRQEQQKAEKEKHKTDKKGKEKEKCKTTKQKSMGFQRKTSKHPRLDDDYKKVA